MVLLATYLSTGNILLIGSILLFISIIAGKSTYRFGVPTLLLFLAIGMLAGSEGIGKINFDDPHTAQFVGIVALNLILFSGGLDTNINAIKPVMVKGMVLSTLGVFITAALVGVFVWLVTPFNLLEGLLLGSIVSSTDAAAVFSILRTRSVGLKGNIRPTLELESGSNDPMAYFLTISLTGIVSQGDQDVWSLIPLFFMQITIGAALGFTFGKVGAYAMNKIKLDFEGLYPVFMLAIAFFSFSATEFLQGNGFLAVYLSAVMLGNKDIIHKKSIIKFFDGMAWLMQIVLFLTLGLLVFPSRMLPVIGMGLAISLFMIFVARPISVFASLAFFKLNNRSKLFISWVGLRGAVPIVFATYPLIAGIEKADIIFHIVFFISVTSVVLQGTTLPIMARWLHVAVPEKVKRRTPLDLELSESVKSELIEIDLPENSPKAGKPIVELGFPKTALIVMINRNGRYLTPNGATVLEPADKLLILAENKDALNKAIEHLVPH
jgi:potassium/hydrogen antiporter